MKTKLLLLILSAYFPYLLFAQTNFSTVTYGTSTYQPQEIFFGDSEEVYNVGQCSIRGTTNGEIYWTGYCYTILYLYGGDAPARANCFVVGKNGTIRKNESCDIFGSWVDQTSGTADSLFSVKFFNVDTGFVVGQNGKVLRTYNNGRNWTILNTSGTTQTLRRIIYTPDHTLYAVGDNGVAIKSTDNANSWTILNTNTTQRLTDIDFVGNDTLFISGTNGTLLKSTDAGVSWIGINTGVTVKLNGVDFLNGDKGFIVGDSGTVRKTTDGGLSWTPFVLSTYNNNVMDIKFRNDSIGYFAAQSIFYKTLDGGDTWYNLGQELQSVEFPTKDTGYAVGEVMRKTTDGGLTWTATHPFNYPYSNTKMFDAFFLNTDTGWASGYYGSVFKTTDGGNSWTWQNTHCTALLRSIHFFDANNGIAVGTNYTTTRTSDGGTTWITDSFPNPSYYGHHDIFFITPLIGYRCGAQGTISKTVNGGASFTSQTSGTSYYLLKIYFLNPLKGFAIGEHGTLLKTLDGGVTWTTITLPSTSYLSAIAFYDTLNGFIAGESGIFYVTKDGGSTWTYKSNNFGTINDITFYDNYNGYMVGSGDYRARYEPLKLLNDFSDICKGGNFTTIPVIAANVQIDTGNVFVVEMDTTGVDFNDAITIGVSKSDTAGGYLPFKVNSDIKAGRYKVRMRATKTTPVSVSVPTALRVFDNPVTSIWQSNDTLFTEYNPQYLYQWRNGYTNIPGANSSIIIITQSGDYNVVVKYGCCNDGYASVYVNQCNGQWVKAPIVKPYYYVCDSSAAKLIANGATQYHWYNSDTSTTVLSSDSFYITPPITAADTYYVAAVYGTCESDRIRIIINKTTKPLAPVISDFYQCSNNEIFIFPQGATSSYYNWYNDSTSAPFLTNASFYHIPNPVSDTLYINTNNYDCYSDFVPVILTIGITPTANSIIGDTAVVPLQTTTYYYTASPGNTLQWIISGGTYTVYNDSIVISWGNAGSGLIQLIETDPNGCSGDTVELAIDINIINSINDENESGVFIYPNPVEDLLQVKLPGQFNEPVKLQLYSAMAQLLFEDELTGESNTISLKEYSPGIYVVKLLVGGRQIISKIVYKP